MTLFTIHISNWPVAIEENCFAPTFLFRFLLPPASRLHRRINQNSVTTLTNNFFKYNQRTPISSTPERWLFRRLFLSVFIWKRLGFDALLCIYYSADCTNILYSYFLVVSRFLPLRLVLKMYGKDNYHVCV